MPGPEGSNGPSALKSVIVVVFLIKAVSVVTGSAPTYQWKDPVTGQAVTCEKCPPGTSVESHCTSEAPTKCQPCPDLHYTQFWNYVERCRYCNVFCGDEHEVEVQPCNATHNRHCECQPGFFLNFDFCIAHSPCPAGFGVLRLGTVYEDTQCKKCLQGTFSSGSSTTAACQPHRDCQKEGLKVNVEGNRYHDTLCTACNSHNATSTPEECNQALFDFLVSQLTEKQLNQLLRKSGNPKTKREHPHPRLNKKAMRRLKALFTTLTDLDPGNSTVNSLLPLLERANLNRIKKVVHNNFSIQTNRGQSPPE